MDSRPDVERKSARLHLADLGAEFPATESLTYLNTASIGLMPRSVLEVSERFGHELATRGTTWFDEDQEIGTLRRASTAAARLIGTSADQVAITTSVTEAISQLAWWIRPGRGTNVVLVDIDFPSDTYPWMRVARETGAEIRLTEASDAPDTLSIDAISELVDRRTAVICLSHVQYATGFRADLARLSELARQNGAFLLVDGTQSVGAVPVDLAGLAVDAFFCAGYKWLCGPFGAAICALEKSLLERFEPPIVGWKSAPAPYEMDASRLVLSDGAPAMEFSTMAYAAGVALAAAIEWIEALGIGAIHEHTTRLAGHILDRLVAMGATPITPLVAEERAGIASVRFDVPSHTLAAALSSEKVIVSQRFGCLRFSPHLMNTEEDVERGLSVTEAALKKARA